MLREYVLSPDIFDSSCYQDAALCRIHLQNLKEPLLQEGLVRDLRDGGWSNYVRNDQFPLDKMGKELLKKLKSQNRLRRFPAFPENKEPQSYREWCQEALASHGQESLQGIIASEELKKEFVDRKEVGSIEKLYQTRWWQDRSSSTRVARKVEDYLEKLNLVLTQANSLMFIDPNIDPESSNYRDFYRLLHATRRPGIVPQIEIHRKCARGSGRKAEVIGNKQWEKIFRDNFEELFYNEGLKAEVFIWDDFHDRYLITDIIGINLPYGFDTDPRPKARTTWCRLGREDKDDIQREFDPAANHHKLQYRFLIIE
jgi:hypothetical protein